MQVFGEASPERPLTGCLQLVCPSGSPYRSWASREYVNNLGVSNEAILGTHSFGHSCFGSPWLQPKRSTGGRDLHVGGPSLFRADPESVPGENWDRSESCV